MSEPMGAAVQYLFLLAVVVVWFHACVYVVPR